VAIRRLILTAIPEDYSPDTDIPIGPWCFSNAESVFPQWEDITYETPIQTPAERSQADTLTRGLANQLAKTWSKRLNKDHDRQYGHLYWRTLIIEWLVFAAQATWYRYCLIEKIVKRFGDEALHIPVFAGDANWTFPDQETFIQQLMNGPVFDFWLYSLIVRKLAPDTWQLLPEETELPTDYNIPGTIQFMQQNRIAAIYRQIFGRFSVDTVPGLKKLKLPFSIYVNCLPKHLLGTDQSSKDDNTYIDKFPKEFLSLLDDVLLRTLPAAFGPSFETYEEEAKKWRYVPGRLLVDNLGTVVTSGRFRLAHAVEAGERLVGNQHGGWYGTAQAIACAAETDYNHLAFLTWGWRAQGNLAGNFVPLPSPLLAPIRNRHKCKEESLLLVGASIFLKTRLFDSMPSPPRWVAYRKMKRQFIGALQTSPRAKLLYRPHLRGIPNLQDGDYVQHHFPGVPIFRGDLTKKMLRSKLLVLDHPGTTLHLALAANVPTICFWHPDDWPLCDQADGYFEDLRKNGVLHSTPESAALYINEIWPDVSGWWNQKERQNARRQWCWEYARSSRFWWLHWISCLWRLANNRAIPNDTHASV